MWTVYEPYHAAVYFAPEARQAYTAAGLKGFWMGYFASRAAALGPVSAPVVTALFFNFAPRMVERAIPDAWRFSTPERVLAARFEAVDHALRRLLGDAVHSSGLSEAAALAQQATEGCDAAGRPLYAAHSALTWPQEPHLILWHAATLLREFRGDGHVANLLAAGLDGCEALVTMAASGAVARAVLEPHRGWSEEEWAAAEHRLRERAWLDQSGTLTEEGRARRREIEARTDLLALPPWERLGAAGTSRLYELLRPLCRQIATAGGVPFPNPVGVPPPDDS
jgi:hypothetical protein